MLLFEHVAHSAHRYEGDIGFACFDGAIGTGRSPRVVQNAPSSSNVEHPMVAMGFVTTLRGAIREHSWADL